MAKDVAQPVVDSLPPPPHDPIPIEDLIRSAVWICAAIIKAKAFELSRDPKPRPMSDLDRWRLEYRRIRRVEARCRA